jgi:hypothetical protein
MAPKVTIHHEPKSDTPSEAIVNKANAVQTVTDTKGRQIGIRKLKALDRMRMFEVLGAENSKNEMYLGYSALAFHVSSIDGEAIHRPTTKVALEALIQQLGDEGLDAVGEALQKQMKEAATEAERLEQIKN